MKALSLACFIAVVFCGRLCIVFFAGSPIPFHDQWYAEAQGILMPYLHHQLVVGHFFAPNGDHVIALTRALALLLVIIEGKWDCITQMVINSALSPFCLWPLMYWAVRRNSVRVASVVCLVIGVIYGSPLFYGNIVWGFQSQILLMISLSLSHLYLVVIRPAGWARWLLGMMCGLLAAMSFASGFIATVVCALALLSSWRYLHLSVRYLVGTIVGCFSIIVFALWLTPAHSGMSEIDPARVGHTFVHALSFPDRMFSYWGLLFWAPAACGLVLTAIRRDLTADWFFPLTIAVWCLGQILAISLGRSEPAIVLAPRYYDIFMVGVLANCCLAIEFVKHRWVKQSIRSAVTIGFVFWLTVIGYKAARFIDSHTRGDMPVLVAHATQQTGLVARFYAGQRNVEIVRRSPFPIRTLPDADFLGEMLGRKEIMSLWPSYIFSWRPDETLRELPWIGERISRDDWFRGSLLMGVIAVVILYAIVLWSVFERRAEPAMTQPVAARG